MGRRLEVEPEAVEETGWPIKARERVRQLTLRSKVTWPFLEEHGCGIDRFADLNRSAWAEKRSSLEVLEEEIARMGLTAEYEVRLETLDPEVRASLAKAGL